MKVKIISRPTQMLEDRDWRDRYQVQLTTEDTDISTDFHDGEPEDANISRDFADVYDIPKMLKAAYEAGKRGESYEEVREDEADK